MGDTSVGSSRGHGWREVAVQILIRVVAALIVAAGGFLFGLATGRNKERELYARTVQDAPNAFADRIGELIAQAEISGIDDVRVTGQALVSARNDLRSSLTNLSRLLNSDIDRLEALVSDLDSLRLRDAPAKDQDRARRLAHEQVQVLSAKWPSKREQVATEIRKTIAELGLAPQAR